MTGRWLCRLNYEDYKKHEKEIDKKLLSLKEPTDEYEGLDNLYIIEANLEEDGKERDHFLMFEGQYNNCPFRLIEDTLYEREERYIRLKKLDEKYKTRKKEMTEDDYEEAVNSRSYYSPIIDEDFCEVLCGIDDGTCENAKIIKEIV